jgi:AmpE protein
MTFPVLLLTALLVAFTPLRNGFPVDLPGIWVRFLGARVSRLPGWLIPLGLLLPLLPLGWLLWAFQGVAYGVFLLVLQVLILLIALGGTDPLGHFGASFERAWERGDIAAANLLAQRELGESAEDASSLLADMRGRLAWEACQAYFVPVFWFVVLGPLGALGYRIWFVAVRRIEGVQVLPALVHALEWLPLRLMGLALALVGHFDPVLAKLRQLVGSWDAPSELAVKSLALAALGPEPHAPLVPLRVLLQRALLVWALFVAFVDLAG